MKRLGLILSLAAVSLIFLGVQNATFAQDTRLKLVQEGTLETIKKRGRLMVGVATFVPSAMRAKDGTMIGFQVDVANKVAADMGVKIEHVPTAFPGIIPALLSGKFDIIIAGMEMKPSRNLQVNFSNPYVWGSQGMVASKELAGKFKVSSPRMSKQDDFNKAGVTFAMRRGTSPIQVVKKHFPNAKILQFEDDQQAVQDVINGNSHAFLSSEPKVSFQVIDNPGRLFKPYGDQVFQRWPGSFALRKGDVDFLNFMNNWITIYKENGFIDERFAYWFSYERPWLDLVESK